MRLSSNNIDILRCFTLWQAGLLDCEIACTAEIRAGACSHLLARPESPRIERTTRVTRTCCYDVLLDAGTHKPPLFFMYNVPDASRPNTIGIIFRGVLKTIPSALDLELTYEYATQSSYIKWI